MSPAARRRRSPLAIAAVLLSAAALALLWALVAGDLPVTIADVMGALSGGDGISAAIIRELRLPRAVAAFACGGLLATAGALMQVLLRNPLADPYILGISGGAAVAALGAITLGAATFWVDASAFAGALTAMVVVFGLAHGDGSWTQTRLLLTGVIVAAGCGAAVSLMLALAPDTRVMSMLFWMMGDASAAAQAGLARARRTGHDQQDAPARRAFIQHSAPVHATVRSPPSGPGPSRSARW